MRLACLILILVNMPAFAADPPAPPVPLVHVPSGPPPAPAPPPPPAGPLLLAADALLVVDASVPCVVLVSPQGMATVTMDSGPIKIKAKFVDGPQDKTICRTYTAKYVYTVEATGSGPAELLVIFTDAAGVTQTIRRALDVGAPTPAPTPTPPTPADPFTQALQDAYKSEADPAKVANVAALRDLYTAAANVSAEDITIVTVDQMTAKLHVVEKAMLAGGDAAMPKVRKVIQAELDAVLGADGTKPLPADRTIVAKEFVRIATALGGLK